MATRVSTNFPRICSARWGDSINSERAAFNEEKKRLLQDHMVAIGKLTKEARDQLQEQTEKAEEASRNLLETQKKSLSELQKESTDKLQEAKEGCKLTEQKLKNAEEQLKTSEHQLKVSEEKLKACEGQLKVLEEKLKACEEELRKEKAYSDHGIQSLKNENEMVCKRLATLQETLKQKTETIRSQESKITELQLELKTLKEREEKIMNHGKKLRAKTDAERIVYTAEIKEAKQEIESLACDLKNEKAAHQSAKIQLENFEQKMKPIQKTIKQIRDDKKWIDGKEDVQFLNNLVLVLDNYKSKSVIFEEKYLPKQKADTARIKELEEKEANLKHSLRTMEIHIADLKAKYETLKARQHDVSIHTAYK